MGVVFIRIYETIAHAACEGMICARNMASQMGNRTSGPERHKCRGDLSKTRRLQITHSLWWPWLNLGPLAADASSRMSASAKNSSQLAPLHVYICLLPLSSLLVCFQIRRRPAPSAHVSCPLTLLILQLESRLEQAWNLVQELVSVWYNHLILKRWPTNGGCPMHDLPLTCQRPGGKTRCIEVPCLLQVKTG